MANSKEVTVVLNEELKERIATADLGGFVEHIAELIARERIKEITALCDNNNSNDAPKAK